MEKSIKELIQKEIEAIGNIPVNISFELAINKIRNIFVKKYWRVFYKKWGLFDCSEVCNNINSC